MTLYYVHLVGILRIYLTIYWFTREEKLSMLQPIVDQLPGYEKRRMELETKIAEVLLSLSYSTVFLFVCC